MKNLFYRIDKNGNAVIFEDDDVCTRIDANIYPIGSAMSARYEHPGGIILSVEDAESLGIKNSH